jgi:hypothetical protein
MEAKLTRLIHKIAIQLHLVQRAVPFAGGQSGNFWIHARTVSTVDNSEKTQFLIVDAQG